MNTAPPLLLQVLDENLSAGDVEQVIEERTEIGIEDLQVTFAGLLEDDVIATLGTTSDFFELRTIVRIGTIRFTMYSLLYRTDQGQVAVVQRSYGNPP